MSNLNHIQELQSAISKLKREPAQKWHGKISKSSKVRMIEKKIQSLVKGH
jgi:hypothetical protein